MIFLNPVNTEDRHSHTGPCVAYSELRDVQLSYIEQIITELSSAAKDAVGFDVCVCVCLCSD